MLEGNHIDIEIFLENTSLPFADHILETINKRRQQMQQGQMPKAMLSPETMAQQAGSGAAPAMNQQTQAVLDTLMQKARA